jgi:hypothetical protein
MAVAVEVTVAFWIGSMDVSNGLVPQALTLLRIMTARTV